MVACPRCGSRCGKDGRMFEPSPGCLDLEEGEEIPEWMPQWKRIPIGLMTKEKAVNSAKHESTKIEARAVDPRVGFGQGLSRAEDRVVVAFD